MRIPYTRNPLVNKCPLTKLNRLLLAAVASWNVIHSGLVKAEKGTFWNSTLSHKMCPRNQTTEPKLLTLESFFSGEVTSYTDTSHCIHISWEVCRSGFYGSPCLNRGDTGHRVALDIRRRKYVLSPKCSRNIFIHEISYTRRCINITKLRKLISEIVDRSPTGLR